MRQQQLRGDVPDVLVYDKIPQELRVQLVHIFRDYLGNEKDMNEYNFMSQDAFEHIVESLCREYGIFCLSSASKHGNRNYFTELFNFILMEPNVERVLDAVELACKVIDKFSRSYDYRHRRKADEEASAALAELNARFLQHGFGYRFDAGDIVRVDSEIVHAEVIKPALALLHNAKYKGAEAEFHLAFEHYRHGRAKEALAECLKALESTLKTIAKIQGWEHEPNATAKPLLNLMFDKQLIPQFWAQQFSGLRGVIESGVPTARNRLSGHGQGAEIVNVPPHFVSFALHQTAATIIFLVKAEEALP
jgi:hypothetical protein